MFGYDCTENYENIKTKNKKTKMTNTLTFVDMIAAKIMKTCKQIQHMSKNDKSIDIFEYDCSENYEKI